LGRALARVIAALRPPSILLLTAAFFDELSSGIAPLGAPEVEDHFRLTHGMAAGWPIAAMHLLAIVVEPPIFALADRYPKRRFIVAGFVLVGISCIVAGLTSSYLVLLGALLVYGPADGCGVVLSQAALIDANPDARERTLTRWTLASSLGDLATPLLLTLLAAGGASWRAAFVACGGLAILYAAAIARFSPATQALPAAEATPVDPEDEPAPPLPAAWKMIASQRALPLWAAGLMLCGLLDEIFVAFGSLYLRERLQLSARQRSFVFEAWMIGSITGLLVLERLLPRVRARVLLIATSLGSLLAFSAWLAASNWQLSAAGAALLGCFVAPQYPLAKAQAYRARPGQSGLVNAFCAFFLPIEIASPVLIGLLADRLGILPALALLSLQPLGLIGVALISLRASGAAGGARSAADSASDAR
jgi:predicted MFS family arabinose efflux permease